MEGERGEERWEVFTGHEAADRDLIYAKWVIFY